MTFDQDTNLADYFAKDASLLKNLCLRFSEIFGTLANYRHFKWHTFPLFLAESVCHLMKRADSVHFHQSYFSQPFLIAILLWEFFRQFSDKKMAVLSVEDGVMGRERQIIV